MNTEEALKKAGIGKRKWALFLKIASDNRKMKDHGWAYLGGMRDALWAMTSKDKAVYDHLNAQLGTVPRIVTEGERAY